MRTPVRRSHQGAARRTHAGLLILLTIVLAATACAADDDGESLDTAEEPTAADVGAATAQPSPEDGDGQTPAATGDAEAGDGAEAEDGAEGEPVLIGVNIEQSGPASVQGEAYARAVALQAERLNADGGCAGSPIELEIVDNGTDPTEAVTQTQQLLDRGVVAMVGPGTSPTTMAAMESIVQAGIPVVSMGSADAIVEPVEDRPNVFKSAQRGSSMARGIAEHMQQEGIERIGLLAVNNPYGDDGIAAWEDIEGIEVARTERFETADTDMSAQLRNLQDADVDAIVTWAIPPGAPTVRRNAVEDLGVELPMYFDAGAGAELFTELAGSAADGALIVHPRTMIWDQVAEDHPQYDALQEFGTAYTEAHGEMSGFAGYAWDALGLLCAGMDEAGSAEPEAIIEGLETMGEYVGVTGVFAITAEDHVGLGDDAMEILTIEDGEWRTVD